MSNESAYNLPQAQPLDEHNRTLVDHVHPTDWVNPQPTGRYNMVVIGGGTAGLVTAAGAAGLGAKVALIERELMGGDCLNVGCVPSKALIRCARAAAAARRASDLGVRFEGEIAVDFPAVMQRMRELRADISHHDSAKRFSELGVDIFLGRGRFVGPNTIEVAGRQLEFTRACIATGARAVELPIPGLKDVGFLTNETVFSLTELPKRLAIIGGGPIGCELAQSFARFGCEVHLLEANAQILNREDRDAAQRIEESLKHDGVKLICNSKISRIHAQGEDKMIVFEGHDDYQELRVDQILIGVGRAPNVEELDLDKAGVAFDRTGVKVNEYLQTSNPKIYAAGDICFAYKFTHTADAMARIVIQNALFSLGPFGRKKTSALTIPWCTYTDPEIAHVGLYAHEAEKKGLTVHTITIELSQVDRAILDSETEGFLKVHLRKGSDQILGATLVASHAGDMISQLTQAMVTRTGLGAIANVIHPYPTQAEVIKRAADAYNRTRLTPRAASILKTILRWRR